MQQTSLTRAIARWVGAAVLACLFSGAAGAQVDDNSLTMLRGNTSRNARPEFDQGRAPNSLPQEHILMMLRRSEPQQQALQQFMERQYDPHSADFHHWL